MFCKGLTLNSEPITLRLFRMKRNSESKNKPVLVDIPIKIIKARSGWQLIDLKELKEYRDLFFFMVWREIKVLYAQTILGFSWAILNPLVQIVIFTVIFGKVAKVSTRAFRIFFFQVWLSYPGPTCHSP